MVPAWLLNWACASCADTLLRLVRQAPAPPVPTPRVLGIDDWSFLRGKIFEAILLDLERWVPIDLLPDREVESCVAWLQAHPGIETISRDRGETYAEAARIGAPQAKQVADRWHLLKNLGEALETSRGPARSGAAAGGT